MDNRNLNPDSMIHDQLNGQWQKLLTFVLWKLAPNETVRITSEDMKALTDHFEPGIPVLCTRGTGDAFEFSVITQERAMVLAEHEKTQRGRA